VKPTTIIESPTDFIVKDYAPGLSIDFRNPPSCTAVSRVRDQLDFELWRSFSADRLLARADKLCCELGVSERPDDISQSLRLFSGETDASLCLQRSARTLTDVKMSEEPLDQLLALLEETGLLQPPPHWPVRLFCHDPNHVTELEADATHFGYVLSGRMSLELCEQQSYDLHPGCYFCVPGPAYVEGDGEVEIITSFTYRGLFSLGGPVEPWGRLQYIDGCTDTLLIPPVKRGDPCLNSLYFPANTRQTQHTHPSLRAGMVIGGKGVCKTPDGDHVLRPGRIFFLPPETWHAFFTEENRTETKSALTVVAFHPDSDAGPTDEDHPMLNRTYFQFYHRLRSLERLPGPKPELNLA
jgi:quercetin dioxygenase-like cupin family protein